MWISLGVHASSRKGGGGEFARDATAVIQIRCDTWLAIAKKYMA